MTETFDSWRAELRPRGFRGLGTGGRTGLYVGRNAGPVQQAIGVLVAEHREGAFNVQLNLNLPLPASEPPHQVVVLEGDLSPTAVQVREPWVHDPQANTWWAPADVGVAWSALVERGLPWLDRYADPAMLIRYLEGEHERLEARARAQQRSGLATRVGRRLGLLRAPVPTAHYQYLLWLSMLHELEGRMDRARECLRAYAAEVERRGPAAERERVERHMRALEGGAGGAAPGGPTDPGAGA